VKFILTIFALAGIILILISKNEKRYEKLAKENNEQFAKQNIKILQRSGYMLLCLAALSFLFF